MKNLKDFYYKKFESDNYFNRWKKNDNQEYMDATKGKLRNWRMQG